MDSVCEDKMSIQLARNGGIGILHRYNSIQQQVQMLKNVKRAENLLIQNPYIVDLNSDVAEVYQIAQALNIYGFLITDLKQSERDEKNEDVVFQKDVFNNDKIPLVGIITKRDFKNRKPGHKVKDLMTPRDKLVVLVKQKNASLKDFKVNKMH